jgi:hypothetical protein
MAHRLERIVARIREQADTTDVDYLISTTNDRGMIVDSLNISEVVGNCMLRLEEDNTSNAGKVKLGDFLCDKLCDIYFLSHERQDTISKSLTQVVYTGEDLITPVRLRFLRFKHPKVPFEICRRTAQMGIRDILETVPYFQILKFIVQSPCADEEMCNDVLNEFEAMFIDEGVSIYTKMEIADIFILNRREERGHEMLDILREMEGQHEDAAGVPIGNLRPAALVGFRQQEHGNTVYEDRQNVHATAINTSVLKACIALISSEGETEFDIEEVRRTLKEISPKDIYSINTVLERVEIDTSTFRLKDDAFNMYVLFSCLWSFITKHQNKDDILLRLVEEMIAMASYCSTGHLSRFINVVQGYTSDPDMEMRISEYDQVKSVISHYLDKLIVSAEDDVVEAMIDNNKAPFFAFVIEIMNEKIPDLISEYGNVQEEIVKAIANYTQWQHWTIIGNELTILEAEGEAGEEGEEGGAEL